ncbi:nucleotidyltransferase family protein [Candidatus Pelagibacter sp.]|nr:nucleotidyltransferase family protein [Candidatus Pelagibacter sp.]
MYSLKKTNSLVIFKNQKIFQAIDKINKSKTKILFVVNENNKLLGSISSGDIRRSIRKKIDLNQSVQKIMFKSPKYLLKKEKIAVSKEYLICIPIVNNNREIIDFQFSQIVRKDKKNTIFLMAGGKGTRLLPLTKKTPKPLLKIKGIPIIEKIILNFRNQGFKNFTISVNYLAHKIKKYLGDGKKLRVNITYINEKKYLGTAGSLSLINLKKTIFPIIIANSDLISEIDYNNLISYHNKKTSDLTICAKNKIFKMPYGEIVQNQDKIRKIIEKPSIYHLVNAGVYVANKGILKNIIKNEQLMMNEFINKQLKKNKKVYSYPVYENWIDIGNKIDFYNYR